MKWTAKEGKRTNEEKGRGGRRMFLLNDDRVGYRVAGEKQKQQAEAD